MTGGDMDAVGGAVTTGVGDAELRTARRERLFDAIDCVGMDALVLGRRDSVAYASGVRSLWTAATRPFGAGCVMVAASRSMHLLSTWDEGVPPDVPFDNLYGITWNPARMSDALAAIPGLADARRIGVDALSPGFAHTVGRFAPDAEIVPADDLVQAVRALKLPAEVARIRAAADVCRSALAAAIAVLGDGDGVVPARVAALRAAGERGATVPSSGVDVRSSDGDVRPHVHVDVGLLVDGYEGGTGRTFAGLSARQRPAQRPDPGGDRVASAAQRALLDACRPGASAADLRTAAAAAGAIRWMVRGSGMGFERPVVTDTLGTAATIEEGRRCRSRPSRYP
jgi:Xaa-Pro dipeptidase